MLFAILSLLDFKKNLNLEMNFCIKQMKELQRKDRSLTKALISLNPLALSLRFQRKTAEAAYIAAPPPYKPAAWARLQQVKLMQKAFRAKQLSLLQTAKFHQIKIKSQMLLKAYRPIKLKNSLVLKKTPKKSDSPSYKLQKNYSEKKKVLYQKLKHPLSLNSKTLSKWLKVQPQIVKLKCGSTLSQKNGKPWKIKYILGKF